MLKCFHLKAIVFVPLAGTDVQFVQAALFIPGRGRDVLVEPLPQQIGEEMMIPVPVPLVIHGNEEQIGALQIF